MKASDIMTFGVATVPAGASLGDAARTLLNHRIRSLPVVDPDGKLVGILSESDLVRALAGPDRPVARQYRLGEGRALLIHHAVVLGAGHGAFSRGPPVRLHLRPAASGC